MKYRALVIWGVRVVRLLWPVVRAVVETQETEEKPGSEKFVAAVDEALPLAAAALSEKGYDVSAAALHAIVGGLVELVILVRRLINR